VRKRERKSRPARKEDQQRIVRHSTFFGGSAGRTKTGGEEGGRVPFTFPIKSQKEASEEVKEEAERNGSL